MGTMSSVDMSERTELCRVTVGSSIFVRFLCFVIDASLPVMRWYDLELRTSDKAYRTHKCPQVRGLPALCAPLARLKSHFLLLLSSDFEPCPTQMSDLIS